MNGRTSTLRRARMRTRAGWRNAVLVALSLGGALGVDSHAATFTYSAASGTDQWSTGTNWAPVPVSAATTTLLFGAAGSTSTSGLVLASGATVTTNNDLSTTPFVLNQFIAGYRTTTATTPAPIATIQGNALQFVADGATAPAMLLTTNGSTTAAKPVIIVSNNVSVAANEFTVTANSNGGGNTGSANVQLTGTFGFTGTGPNTMTLAGSGGSGSNFSARYEFGGAIANGPTPATDVTSLVKNGVSFWQLNGANTYTGGTTINGGVLRAMQAGGFGTGDIVVANGGQAFFNAGTATFSNNLTIAGIGPSTTPNTVGGNIGAIALGAGTTLNGTITLADSARIGTFSGTVTLDSKITAATGSNIGLTIGSAAGLGASTYNLNNTANDYTGDTTLWGEARGYNISSSGGAMTVIVGNNEVIPHGPAAGNLIMNMGDGAANTLNLNGKNETINGLSSLGFGANDRRVVTNSALNTTSTFTLGENNASGNFLGTLSDGSSTARLVLVKNGTGKQTLTGTATLRGGTTINGGTLEIDVNDFATTASTTAPTNYYSTASDVTLAGGATFAIRGRDAGAAVSGWNSATTAAGTSTIGLTGGNTTESLTVGQLVTLTGATTTDTFITRILDTTTFTVNTAVAAAGSFTVSTLDTPAAVFNQTLKSMILGGSAGSNATLDLGTVGSVVLTLNGLTQTNDGSTLTIDNWSGLAAGGGAERLLINLPSPADVTAFGAAFSQNEILFSGYGAGYQLIAPSTGTLYEIVPNLVAVPEPSTLALTGLAGVGLFAYRRHRRRSDRA